MESEQKNRACAKRYQELLPGLTDYIDRWAKCYPQGIAIVEYSTGEEITWKDLTRKSKAFSAKLLTMGLRKGDVVATSLPLLKEHVYLIFACLHVVAFDVTDRDRMLVNLPPSHVGCLTEQLAMTVYAGGTSIILPIYKADDSLKAIVKYKATMLGQIPAMYNMQWLLPDYSAYNLSSLRIAVYGGQSVSTGFLDRLSRMAPQIGSGLGLTETAGFCTYTPIHADRGSIQKSLGFCSPLCPITIREPIGVDGKAGGIKPSGEIGEVCFEGPQVFLGYLNDESNTGRTISKEGICYTGDMGHYDEQGLHLSGRRKEIIKPKGYQVFPGDVESFLAAKFGDRVTSIACVGAPHEVFSEAIVAFIEVSNLGKVTAEEVFEIAKGLAAYARRTHVEILPPGGMPLNRVAKTDYLVLKQRAEEIVSSLRERGGWDRADGKGLL